VRAKPLPPLDELQARFTYRPDTGALQRLDGSVVTCRDRAGYLIVGANGRYLKAHRVCWKLHHGEDPVVVDHINGDRSDNRICNLRSVDTTTNLRNRARSAKNTLGVSGVYWDTRNAVWRAHISDGVKKRHLGSFPTIIDAVAARFRAEAQHNYVMR